MLRRLAYKTIALEQNLASPKPIPKSVKTFQVDFGCQVNGIVVTGTNILILSKPMVPSGHDFEALVHSSLSVFDLSRTSDLAKPLERFTFRNKSMFDIRGLERPAYCEPETPGVAYFSKLIGRDDDIQAMKRYADLTIFRIDYRDPNRHRVEEWKKFEVYCPYHIDTYTLFEVYISNAYAIVVGIHLRTDTYFLGSQHLHGDDGSPVLVHNLQVDLKKRPPPICSFVVKNWFHIIQNDVDGVYCCSIRIDKEEGKENLFYPIDGFTHDMARPTRQLVLGGPPSEPHLILWSSEDAQDDIYPVTLQMDEKTHRITGLEHASSPFPLSFPAPRRMRTHWWAGYTGQSLLHVNSKSAFDNHRGPPSAGSHNTMKLLRSTGKGGDLPWSVHELQFDPEAVDMNDTFGLWDDHLGYVLLFDVYSRITIISYV